MIISQPAYSRLQKSLMILMRCCHGILGVARCRCPDSYNGRDTHEHELLCIESGAEMVGYLWHSINVGEKSTFIYDFFIFSSSRNNGYGKLAIITLESQLQSVGIEQIKLRVAYHNQRALELYQEVAFAISGYNMSKKIAS